MEIPSYLQQQMSQNLNIECEAAIDNAVCASRRKLWAVILGLKPFKNGLLWCIVWEGDDMTPIVSVGANPEEAMQNFDEVMKKKGE